MSKGTLLALLLFCMAGGATAGSGPAPIITVDETSITIDGITPGKNVILFGVVAATHQGRPAVQDVAQAIAATQDGHAVWSPVGGVPFRAIWVAVDAQTAQYAIGARPGYPLHPFKLPVDALKKDGSGAFTSIETEAPYAIVLVARPNGGAWKATARAGRNGRSQVALDQAKGVAPTTQPFDHATNGDLIVFIDPLHMNLFVAEMGK